MPYSPGSLIAPLLVLMPSGQKLHCRLRPLSSTYGRQRAPAPLRLFSKPLPLLQVA